ncbi:MAG: protein-tyrosine phosphatase family protein [Planctomycetaceae bacterium]
MRRLPSHLLWLGNAGDLWNPATILDAEIRAVVDLAANEPFPKLPRDLIFCRFPLLDGAGNDPALLHLAVETVSGLLAAGVPTALCCSNGLSRSPAIAAAVVGLRDRIPLDDALIRVASTAKHDVVPALWQEIKAVCGPA